MIPIQAGRRTTTTATVTLTLIVLNTVIFFWDRLGAIAGPSRVFADLAMRPVEVIMAIQGQGDRFALATVLTSMFLHGGFAHLLFNMIFLGTFGQAVESAFGPPRFALYYLFWGVCAAAAHVFVLPGSDIPMIGASGAIGGVLGVYLLLYPASKVQIVLLPFPLPFSVRAWIMLGAWFLWQVFVRQEGVANWAHVGGFLAGMLTVLIMGGPKAMLKHDTTQEDHDVDD